MQDEHEKCENNASPERFIIGFSYAGIQIRAMVIKSGNALVTRSAMFGRVEHTSIATHITLIVIAFAIPRFSTLINVKIMLMTYPAASAAFYFSIVGSTGSHFVVRAA